MSQFVVLNLEDKIGDTQKGAADSTISGLKGRYEVRKQPKGLAKLFTAKNSVTEYRAVTSAPVIGFTTDTTAIAAIRAACSSAKKVYLVMHGDPRNTDMCYTNNVGSAAGVHPLATPKQLAAFLSQVLTSGKHEYNLALVMCYGARCKEYQSAKVDHQGMIPKGHLVTSFAYRLLHALVTDHGIKARMSAVTGKIQHDSGTGMALVEHEDMIDVNMEIAEADKAKRESMKAAVGGTLLPQDKQDQQYKENESAWKKSDEGQSLLNASASARSSRDATLKKLSAVGHNQEMRKYGKIQYLVKNGKLTVITKYGDSTRGMKAGTTIYSGPILPPG